MSTSDMMEMLYLINGKMKDIPSRIEALQKNLTRMGLEMVTNVNKMLRLSSSMLPSFGWKLP